MDSHSTNQNVRFVEIANIKCSHGSRWIQGKLVTYVKKLGDLPDEPLEGHLPYEQLSALLVLANLTAEVDREV